LDSFPANPAVAVAPAGRQTPGHVTLLGVVLLLGLAVHARAAETAYISDRLTVPLRSGPSNANRILHRGLPSGTRLTVLSTEEEDGFVRVRTDQDLEGWVPAQYLVDQPIARDQLEAANRRLRELGETVERQRRELSDTRGNMNASEQSVEELQRRVAELEQELAEIRRISAGAIAQNETNKELNALNERLRAEVDDLVSNIETLEDNVQQRWLLFGGALVLAGLLLGVAIKSRPRRSAWS